MRTFLLLKILFIVSNIDAQSPKELSRHFNTLENLCYDSLKYYPLNNKVDAIYIDNEFIKTRNTDSIKTIIDNCGINNIEIIKLDSLRNDIYLTTFKINSSKVLPNNPENFNITVPSMNLFRLLRRDMEGNIKDTITSVFGFDGVALLESDDNIIFEKGEILIYYRTNYTKYYIGFSLKKQKPVASSTTGFITNLTLIALSHN